VNSDVLLVSLLLLLAVATGALAVWALRLHGRVERLGRELADAWEQAARAQRLDALGEMAASFAHSFNDVLTPILGRTQLLAQRVSDPQLREWLGTIEQAATRGAQIVRRIQEFLRGRREGPAAAVDLGVVAQEAVRAVLARRPSVEVVAEVDAAPSVTGDPLALREAVAHVLRNAVEASPPGGRVVVGVALEQGEAVVSVVDRGPGIARDVQARIFEPFFTTKPEGAGLGLCLAYGIVVRHGGQIEVDSAPGRGTTVRLRFPVSAVLRPAPPGPAGAPPPPGPARCLVVDDDPQVREMIRDILSNAGHAVTLAVDGADGVERFKAEPFDLVISDLAMPRLNGLQLARVCKAVRPEVPVVLLTGWGVLLTEEELAEHGVDEVLSKPVRMDQVLGTVATLRGRATTRART